MSAAKAFVDDGDDVVVASVPPQQPVQVPDYKASKAETAGEAAPRRGRGRPPGSPNKPKAAPAPAGFVEPVEALYLTVAMLSAPVAPPTVTQALLTQARPCAEAWDHLAESNESVRRLLTRLTTASVGVELAVAHLPLLMAVAGSIPAVAGLLGRPADVPPDDGLARDVPVDDGQGQYVRAS